MRFSLALLVSKFGHFESQNLTPAAGSTPLSLQGPRRWAGANETQSIPQLFSVMSLGMAEGGSGLGQPPACLEGSFSSLGTWSLNNVNLGLMIAKNRAGYIGK